MAKRNGRNGKRKVISPFRVIVGKHRENDMKFLKGNSKLLQKLLQNFA